MTLLETIASEAVTTLLDIGPVIVAIALFQAMLVRRLPYNLASILVGLFYLFLGLLLFRVGLAMSLLPAGTFMAEHLSMPARATDGADWTLYLPLYLFAAMIGLTATLIEPTLIAVADRVDRMSGHALRARTLRIVVATGVAIGLAMGTVRIVTGIPLTHMLLPLLAIIAVSAATAPKALRSLAADSGGIATSVVTVPLITAFGSGVAAGIPGRTPFADGFGLIVLALLTPVAALLAFASVARWTGAGTQRGG